ncbi:hypothetical protein BDW02DRAFT_602258 [Decorospora gaudefroyi]|uniref:BZIP domain-containing protein n=1 Tax=Decorospora gaudefroyi TaxID=184978 RepID=A0A6A5K8S4_9PLEO|nr:hypothetical protein BDW02DRAFT_602258 [Decorospora gaudefroyi]
MSDTYSQQAFGQQIYIGAHVKESSSGFDEINFFNAANLYHQHEYHPGQLHAPPIPTQNVYPQAQQLAFESSGVSLTGLQYASPPMAGHVPQHFELQNTVHIGFDNDLGLATIAPGFNANDAYPAPYPDSNATSTSAATSPDTTTTAAILLTDPVIVEADEDKRKRNQAASARFRHKKKQREQQLVENSREMQERTKKLEEENDGLKKENMFLKKLLVEKVDHMSDEDRNMLKRAAEGALERASKVVC